MGSQLSKLVALELQCCFAGFLSSQLCLELHLLVVEGSELGLHASSIAQHSPQVVLVRHLAGEGAAAVVLSWSKIVDSHSWLPVTR
jgi:hypothetical protein